MATLVNVILTDAVAQESNQVLLARSNDRGKIWFGRNGEWTLCDCLPLKPYVSLLECLQILVESNGTWFPWSHQDGSVFLVHANFGGEQTLLSLELHKS